LGGRGSADVCFVAHYATKSDIAPCPKSAMNGIMQPQTITGSSDHIGGRRNFARPIRPDWDGPDVLRQEAEVSEVVTRLSRSRLPDSWVDADE